MTRPSVRPESIHPDVVTSTLRAAPDLTDDEVKACVSLSMRSQGSMTDELRRYRRQAKRRSRVTMIHDEDGLLLAWSLQTSRRPGAPWAFHVYVRRSHRRLGLARSLLARARMGKRQPLLVIPHSRAAHALYDPLVESGRLIDNYN